ARVKTPSRAATAWPRERPSRHGHRVDSSEASRRTGLDLPVVDSAAPHAHPNQFALLRQRRFAPFFWTQFLGAGNDNLFKFAFTVMVTYQLQLSDPFLQPQLAGLTIGALFILPFLLFSATSGQLA